MQEHAETGGIIDPRLDGLKPRVPTAHIKKDIQSIQDALAAAPQWRPGDLIQAQCRSVLDILQELEQRLDRKLVVTLVGPTGSGKSTLLNALSGVDELSATGHLRPTTRNLVVMCRHETDAARLIDRIGSEHVSICPHPEALSLEHVMLIDTPDTDSTQQENHIDLVRKVIRLSDVLICVFDAENPKRRDHADFMADPVALFHGESLGVVLNKCDRLAEDELRQRVVPEFAEYLSAAWNMNIASVLCISARRNLNRPSWSPQARPKHDYDQFYLLREMVFKALNSDDAVADRRSANAHRLREYLLKEIHEAVSQDRDMLLKASLDIQRVEKAALQKAARAMALDEYRQTMGINVLLYQKLTQRWMGPVGWMVALWGRILIFGTGLAAMFRVGNPLRQIWGLVSSLVRLKESRTAVEETSRGTRLDTAMRDFHMTVMHHWPQIAETLVTARFDHTIRQIEHALPGQDSLNRELSGIWQETMEKILEKTARKWSRFLLQLLFNIPILAVLVLTAIRTTRDFITGHYLSSDFFLHAVFTMGMVLFLSFFILQACLRLGAGPDRLLKAAFAAVEKQVEESRPVPLNDVSLQIQAVLGLPGMDRDRK